MNTVEKLKEICKQRKIPIYKLEKDLGFANGYIGQLKKGTLPDDRLRLVADYLGVTTAFLTGAEEDQELSILAYKIAALAKKISSLDGEEKEKAVREYVQLKTQYDMMTIPIEPNGGIISEKDTKLLLWFRSLPVSKQQAVLISLDAPEGLI